MKSLNIKRSTLGPLATIALLAAVLIVSTPAAARAFNSDSNGDVVVFGGQHTTVQEGQEVKGDLVVMGGSADVYGVVDGDAVALGGKIYIAPKGHVNGSLVNIGGQIENMSNTPQGRGTTITPTFPPTPPPPVVPDEGESASAWFASAWSYFLFIDALLALGAFLLFPARTRSTEEHLVDNPVLAGVLGFFSPIIFVLVITALCVTIVGIPLLPLAVLATIAGYLLGKAAIAKFVGDRLLVAFKVSQPKEVAAVALGLGLFFLVTAGTGWIGIVIYSCTGALGLGAALYMLMRVAQTYRRPPSITPAPVFSPPVDPTRTGPPAVP